jgi:hypothetical protein
MAPKAPKILAGQILRQKISSDKIYPPKFNQGKHFIGVKKKQEKNRKGKLTYKDRFFG